MKKTFLHSLLFTFIIVSGTVSTYAQSGTLDATFGLGGIATTDISPNADKGFSVIQQPDGKILVGGFSNNGVDNDFALIRYDINGVLDNTFGVLGVALTPIGPSNESGQCIILQPDGKILVSGFASNGTNNDFALVRYNTNGTLDLSFDTDGIVSTPIGVGIDQGQSVVLQTNNKILVAGFTDNGTNTDFAIARYNVNGSLDVSFDTDGIVTTDFSATADVGRSIALQADGKIIAAGWSSNGVNLDFAVARYDTTGALDITFDADGKLTTAIGTGDDQGYSVVVQADQQILLAGVSSNGIDMDFATARYNTDGSLDLLYDGDGMVTTDFTAGNDFGYSVALQPDQKILLAGQSLFGPGNDFALARYNTDGSLDLTFDGDGKVTTDLGSNSDVGWSVTVQGDGKVVVAGSNQISTFAIAAVRYNICEFYDTSVTQLGLMLISNAIGPDYQWLNCDSVFSIIPGETNVDYIATANGDYAVVVGVLGCNDTSACHTVNTFGILENSFAKTILIYPNPSIGQFIISTSKPFENATIRLLNVTGQTLKRKENQTGNSILFDISDQTSGIYFIEITEGTNTARTRVIKQ